jgi:hypothetical protein
MNDESLVAHVNDSGEAVTGSDGGSGPLEPLHNPMVVAHLELGPLSLKRLLIQNMLLNDVGGDEGWVELEDEAELVIESLDEEGGAVEVLSGLRRGKKVKNKQEAHTLLNSLISISLGPETSNVTEFREERERERVMGKV